MPAKYLEIRWHGRAGQGAKSASQMLAESALEQGKFVQAFPEYGAERTGAPMKAFTRIGDTPILVRAVIENPDIVIVIDDTLLSPDIVSGLDEKEGVLLVNSVRPFEWIRNKTNFKGKICKVPATDIALEEIKRGVPNTVMLGALVKITGVVPLEAIENRIEKMFLSKFGEEVVSANKKALKRGFEEVQCEEV
ncbi:MAG: 2-oxoacid:acceptor oxidoreductase family protein [Thermotogaceae bacterium]|nr:2-oxoacid:acceptor oxidoreductase family protein [Thermotogaceae bacterium]